MLVQSPALQRGFNPWYVGGGVKRNTYMSVRCADLSFNPWYVGGGVKSIFCHSFFCVPIQFQSLVCWRGC